MNQIEHVRLEQVRQFRLAAGAYRLDALDASKRGDLDAVGRLYDLAHECERRASEIEGWVSDASRPKKTPGPDNPNPGPKGRKGAIVEFEKEIELEEEFAEANGEPGWAEGVAAGVGLVWVPNGSGWLLVGDDGRWWGRGGGRGSCWEDAMDELRRANIKRVVLDGAVVEVPSK